MAQVMDWTKRHPIGAFLAWFTAVGQGFAVIPLLFTNVPSEVFIFGSTVVGMLLPALIITRIVDGRAGLRRLWDRIVRVGVSPGWYAFALL
ncbi:MAG TPA: hypothetical protein VE975_07665, partial [Actinomycetota bacterium]|nr:hypothetical protein [Actinomycetota bacterium]